MRRPVLLFTEKGGQESEQSKNPKYESMSLEELRANMEKVKRNWNMRSTIKIFLNRGKG